MSFTYNQNQNNYNNINNFNTDYNISNNINNNKKIETSFQFNPENKIKQINDNDKYNFQNNYNSNYYNNEDEDYLKKMKEEKYKEIIKSQKKNRFIKIYKNKIKENNSINNNNVEVFFDDYIKLIKELYQDKINYFNYISQMGFFNFSTCPFCGEPAFFIIERVLCINKCFITSVADDVFDEDYTLDNFIEQYKEYYSKHLNCKDDLMTLYIDKESKCAEFLCNKCERNFIDFN